MHRVVDLLFHLPRRYEDRTRLARLGDAIEPGQWVLLRGRVKAPRVRRIPRRRLHIVDGHIEDGDGRIEVVWFNQRWLGQRLLGEPELYLYGQVREARGGNLQLVNPEIEKVAGQAEQITPIYPRLGRFTGRRLRRLIHQCIPAAEECVDPLPADLRSELGLPELRVALRELHQPASPELEDRLEPLLADLNRHRSRFHHRLAFDELLAFACTVTEHRARRKRLEAARIGSEGAFTAIDRHPLPFDLTDAQQRVLGEIVRDFARGEPMARLIQGDVGCGKTVVAVLAMVAVLEAGFQVAMMVPTELLAEQHFRTIENLLAGSGYTPEVLSSSLPASEQRAVKKGLKDGSARLVVGTHALFQESVVFHRLGMVVVDEQHRFGVAQRQALLEKGVAPHLLVMTATPIPRSLALTVYGDLDLSLIDELPPGRGAVRTVVRPRSARNRIFEFVRADIAEGGQAYVVFPAIEGGEDSTMASLAKHEDEVRRLLPGVSVEVLHGRVPREERESIVARFRDGSVKVLLATTVIEVGVDVPGATVMVIESAQGFGLSQLHQLRGRVGRGGRPSWCILVTDDRVGEEARERLEVVCRTKDGFEIAEADLEIRGPGELVGTRQWGPAGFRFADLVRDRELITLTRDLSERLAASGDLDRVRRTLSRYHPIEEVLPAG